MLWERSDRTHVPRALRLKCAQPAQHIQPTIGASRRRLFSRVRQLCLWPVLEDSVLSANSGPRSRSPGSELKRPFVGDFSAEAGIGSGVLPVVTPETLEPLPPFCVRFCEVRVSAPLSAGC